MPRCDVTVQKKFTLNTGNYSSVQPSVSITAHDIIDEDIIKTHKLLEIIADGLLHKQIESDAITMATIKKMGFAEYFKKIRENNEMDSVMEEALKKLTELPPF